MAYTQDQVNWFNQLPDDTARAQVMAQLGLSAQDVSQEEKSIGANYTPEEVASRYQASGTPGGSTGFQLEAKQTGEDGVGAGPQARIPFSYGNGGSAYQLPSMPEPKDIQNAQAVGLQFKNDPQYGPILVSNTPNISAQLTKLASNAYTGPGENMFEKALVSAGVFGMFGAGLGAGGLMGQNLAEFGGSSLAGGTGASSLLGGAANDTLGMGANQLGLQQMGQAAGLSGDALNAFVANGGMADISSLSGMSGFPTNFNQTNNLNLGNNVARAGTSLLNGGNSLTTGGQSLGELEKAVGLGTAGAGAVDLTGNGGSKVDLANSGLNLDGTKNLGSGLLSGAGSTDFLTQLKSLLGLGNGSSNNTSGNSNSGSFDPLQAAFLASQSDQTRSNNNAQMDKLIFANNPLNDAQRQPYQANLANLVNNPSSFFQTDPGYLADASSATDQARAAFGKSGNAMAEQDLSKSLMQAGGAQYGQRIGQLSTLGGFDKQSPSNTGLAGLGQSAANAQSNMFQGLNTNGAANAGNNLFNLATSYFGGNNITPS